MFFYKMIPSGLNFIVLKKTCYKKLCWTKKI
jgi:hypothetical protein